jgi:hypothetical protein
MKPNFKSVEYRGGVVSFDMPEHWKEEYEPKGGGTFYEDRAGSGTLRLHVLDFKSKVGRSSEQTLNRLNEEESRERLSGGLYLKSYVKEAEEGEEALLIYRWEVSIPVPPTGWRVACFSYTIVAGQEREPRIKEEIDLVNQIVRQARFSTNTGVIGDYQPEGNEEEVRRN